MPKYITVKLTSDEIHTLTRLLSREIAETKSEFDVKGNYWQPVYTSMIDRYNFELSLYHRLNNVFRNGKDGRD